MRLLLLVAIPLTLAHVARAGTTTCYAGIDESGDARIPFVILRELDRRTREVRTRSWRANAPHREIETTFHVAADGHAFTYDARGIHGAGTLAGAPWAWTGYHDEGKAFAGRVIADTRLVGDTLQGSIRFEQAGRVRWRVTRAGKAFDCRELARRRAALDNIGPDAKRTCFEGTQTILGATTPVVVEQIVEQKRIVFDTSSPALDNRLVLTIDGATIKASNGHAWTGTGTLAGRPGAWTGYSYRAHIGGSDVAVTGKIGGPRIERTDTTAGRAQAMSSLDAAAFDCAHLEARLAALIATP